MSTDKCRVAVDEVGFAVKCETDMDRMRAESFWSKEPETVRWLKQHMHPHTVFWDVGANVGLFSLYAAALQPACRILAFEPAAHNYASLCDNILLNNADKIQPFSVALGGGELAFDELHLSTMESGSSIHNIGGKSPWATAEPVFRQPCITVSIDEMVSRHGFPAPTLLKLDVDGVELEILRGSVGVLAGIESILVELDAHDAEEVRAASEILEQAGFTLSETSSRSKLINAKLPRNHIFEKSV